ncbi:MAG TPA: hypothetical protein VHQ65_16355 [Thermoanaerobaculia bacterium]|nr:hypothetical protein [Thermoanaerobaculia bacterium]
MTRRPSAAARFAAPLSTLPLLAALLVAPARPAAADDVILKNGRSFEGVVAQVEGDRVAIRLPQGLIRLPMSQVERIERGESPFAVYLERKEALSGSERTTAADWLALARWARDEDLDSGYREAARLAAALDPQAAGLAPLMADLGYVLDDDTGTWMTPDERMRRRGLVWYGGAWITPAERAALAAAAARESAARMEAQRAAQRERVVEHLAAAVRAKAEAERAAETRRARQQSSPTFVYYTPGWYWPAPVPVPEPGDGGAGDGDGGGHGHRPPPRHNSGTFRASDWIPGRLNPGASPPPGRIDSSQQ